MANTKPRNVPMLGYLIRLFAAAGGDVRQARKLAREPQWDAARADLADRALVAGTGAGGGYLVPPEQAAELIELLRARAVVRKLGACILPMRFDNLSVPRLNATAGAGYVGEAVATAAGQANFSQLRFAGKKLIGFVPISNDLLKFASPEADQAAIDDLAALIAVLEDAAFIRGLGTQYSPRGMRYWAAPSNVLVSAGADLANVVADLGAMLASLEPNNVRMVKPGWIFHPRTKNAIRLLQSTTGALVFDEMSRGTLLGYPFKSTTGVPDNLGGGSDQAEFYLADFADAAIAELPGLEISLASKAAYVDAGGTLQAGFSQDVSVLRVVAHHDFGLRHDVSAAVMTQVAY